MKELEFTELDVGKMFRHPRGGVYTVISFCQYPSVMLENIDTKQRISMAAHGPLAQTIKSLTLKTHENISASMHEDIKNAIKTLQELKKKLER